MSSICETPRRDTPLSVELQKVIAERNILTSRTRNKVLSDLNEIHGAETRHLLLRSKTTQEILSSELSYVQQLETIMKFFMDPLSSNGLMSAAHFSAIFGHIETVYRVAEALVSELHSCQEDCLAPAFVRLAPFLKMYSLYACGYHKATNTLQDLRNGRAGSALHSFLQLQESRPEVSCSLQSLLITPVQRLPRYRLLLRELSSHTPPDHPQQATLQEALRGVEISASHVDALLSEQEQQSRLVELQRSLTDGWPQVLSPGRTLIREGAFMKVSKCGTRAVPVQLVLLSDMFLCCRLKSGQLNCRYAFPLARCGLENVLGQAVFKVLCGTETLLLFAKNQDEGEAWTTATIQAISELKSSRQTLRKQNSRKRIPKRLEDLEENVGVRQVEGFLSRALRKRKQGSPGSGSPQVRLTKKLRSSRADPAQSPLRDALYPMRELSDSLPPQRLCLPRPRCGARAKKHVRQFKDSLGLHQEATEVPPPPLGANPALASPAQSPPAPSWSAHCVELVRHVAQCIKAAFLRL